MGEKGGPFNTYDECLAGLNQTRTDTGKYDNSIRTDTSNSEQEAVAIRYGEDHINDPYSLANYNCLDFVKGMLDAAGISYIDVKIPTDFISLNKGKGVWE